MMNGTVFYLLTDTHLVSPQIWEPGGAIDRRERGDQIALKASPEILDAFLAYILADDTAKTVLFTGDNVNGGDLASHAAFRARLERLTAAGKQVFVTTATHDYCGMGDDENFFTACRYAADGTEPVDCMRKAALFDYYYDYGPKQALSVHRESGSYAVRLAAGVRLIMINDNGNGRSHCGLFADGVQWLTDQIHAAQQAGDSVLLAVHHPVLPPWEVFRHLADFELYGGYRDLWALMCETGVRVVFTGHTHVQSIRKYTDDAGRWFVDVATTALVNAAGKMRRVTVDPEAGICRVESVGMDALRAAGIEVPAYEDLYALNFPGILETLLPLGARDYDAFLAAADGFLPVEKLKKWKPLVRFGCRRLEKMKLSSLARLGRVQRSLTPAQRQAAKQTRVADTLFEILRHIYPGNAPFSPETVEFAVLAGAARRLDRITERFGIRSLRKLVPPGSSFEEMAADFLYNTRTGDDDAIEIALK